eukprot:9427159-Alexandrium_andersonii.AAC.1
MAQVRLQAGRHREGALGVGGQRSQTSPTTPSCKTAPPLVARPRLNSPTEAGIHGTSTGHRRSSGGQPSSAPGAEGATTPRALPPSATAQGC